MIIKVAAIALIAIGTISGAAVAQAQESSTFQPLIDDKIARIEEQMARDQATLECIQKLLEDLIDILKGKKKPTEPDPLIMDDDLREYYLMHFKGLAR